MEHPQTVLLSKVLQANISLGNAYTDNLHRSRVVVGLWMDLQQSINLLFDSKTAMSEYSFFLLLIMHYVGEKSLNILRSSPRTQ